MNPTYRRIAIHGAIFDYEAITVPGYHRLAVLPIDGIPTLYYLLPSGKYRRAKRRVTTPIKETTK